MTDRARPDLASAMWPALSREAKAREAAQQQWEAECQRRKQAMVKDLRELNARIDARLQREGRR